MMATIAERVEAGARWLDANRPGWVDRINLDTLALGDCTRCVIGQLEGRFWSEDLDRAFDDVVGVGEWHKVVALGFAQPDDADERQDYRALTQAWRDYITARRAAA